jgi:hypothetical protein
MTKKVVFIQRMGIRSASYRYRSVIPAAQLGGTVNGGEANILVFSKPTPDDVALAYESRAEGLTIVVDFCDNHFAHDTWGPVYHEFAKLAHGIVTATEVMAGQIKEATGRTVDAIIPDPYEEPYAAPHASEASQYLWFGSVVNVKDLLPWLPYIAQKDLTIVTGPNERLNREYYLWSPTMQTEQLQQAHLVLLPTRKGAEHKSPNRLVNALRAGCFPICSAHPAYTEFRKFVWVGNLTTGMKWAESEKAYLNELVAEGQAYIEKFSPESIGRQWEAFLNGLTY